MNIASLKPNHNSVLVTETNLPTGIIFKNKHLITNIGYWHKFIVSNIDEAILEDSWILYYFNLQLKTIIVLDKQC